MRGELAAFVDTNVLVYAVSTDAAILEAARKAGCGLVLSEDLGAGHSYSGIRVENPF